MAKKIARKSLENVEAITSNNKKLIKEYGNVFIDAKSVIDKKRDIFSLGPKLDLALSGGVPSGSWGIISGAPKLGKSSLSLQICANAQKTGRKCYYHDIECRLEKKNLEGVQGLDLSLDKFEIVRSTTGNILTAEKHLSIVEERLKTEPGIVLILDSSSAMCSNKEYDSEISSTGRNDGPKLLAQLTRKLAQIVSVNDSLVIIIQHMIANTSGYGAAYHEDGGNKIVYQADFKLRGTSFNKWEDSKGNQVGQFNCWNVVCSALGQPGAKVVSDFRYGMGIDIVRELVGLACDIGIIEVNGAWFNIPFIDGPKLNGMDNLCNVFRENNDHLEKLQKMVKEAYGY